MAKKREQGASAAPERVSGMQGRQDQQQVLDTIVRAFSNPDHMERHLARCLFRGEYFNPEHTRVAVAGGRVVSAVTMAPRMIRFGAVGVPAMTVGPVGTHNHHRKKGYSFAAMNDASKYMAEHGYLVAYLQGIPNYYYRYGYYPYNVRSQVEFNRKSAKDQAGAGRLVRMKREHLPEVRRIYDEVNARRTCTAIRDDKLWAWLLGEGGKSWMFRYPRVIVDGAGDVCGYITGEKDRLEIREIVLQQEEAAYRAALGALVREARKFEAGTVTLPLPYDDGFAVFLRQMVGSQTKLFSDPTGGLLMKVVDFPALMERLEPVFAERWEAAASALPAAQFNLGCELGSVGIAVERGGVRVGPRARGARVTVPQRWMSGLLTGYYTIADVAPREGAAVPARLVPYLRILFPAGWPYVYQGDNY